MKAPSQSQPDGAGPDWALAERSKLAAENGNTLLFGVKPTGARLLELLDAPGQISHSAPLVVESIFFAHYGRFYVGERGQLSAITRQEAQQRFADHLSAGKGFRLHT